MLIDPKAIAAIRSANLLEGRHKTPLQPARKFKKNLSAAFRHLYLPVSELSMGMLYDPEVSYNTFGDRHKTPLQPKHHGDGDIGI